MLSAPGEAAVVGVRVSRMLNTRFSVDAGVAISQNRSWSGAASASSSDFTKRTTFTSAALLWRPMDSSSRLQVGLGIGPAAIHHGGSGESMLARQVDLGALLAAEASVRLGGRVRVGVDVQNYQFASRFAEMEFDDGGFPADYQPGTRWRSEWVVLPSVRFVF
jgi:hypothetical protein